MRSASRQADAVAPELVILGSGTAIPTCRRGPTGLILAASDRSDVVLVDPGPGAVQRACAAGYPLASLRRVLLTHHHPDHCLDLMALLFALNNPALPEALRQLSLEVIGGPGTAALLRSFTGVFGAWVSLPGDRLVVRELGPGSFRLTPTIAGEAFAVRHSPASLAYRLSFGPVTLALSGDTDECAAAVEVAREADHYLLEAAMPDDRAMPGHLTPTRAARIARDAACGHLVLTHFYPQVDVELARRQAAAVFGGRITIAEDGLRIPLTTTAAESGARP